MKTVIEIHQEQIHKCSVANV